MTLALILVPFVSSLITYMLPVYYSRIVGLYGTVSVLVLSCIIWSIYDPSVLTYQFYINPLSTLYLNFGIGIDGISLYYILLTGFVIPLCVLANWDNLGDRSVKIYIVCILILEGLVIGVFIAVDLLIFYIFFEAVLVPLFLIIGLYGGGSLTIRASFLIFLYTLLGSLFILLSFIVLYSYTGTTDIQLLKLCAFDPQVQNYVFYGVFIALAVKTPIIPLHTWLHWAHAEAPVGGSIVLAGVILKIATYGILRVILTYLPDATYEYSPLVLLIGLISVIYGSIATIRQTDFKKLIAYSSVAHIGVVVIALFSNSLTGLLGGIVLSLGHGVVSPALFILIGGVLYDRFHTRTIAYYRGITVLIPVFGVLCFVFNISNAGVPLTMNWLGEFMSLTGVTENSPFYGALGAITIVLSAIYSIWLFNRISFGSYSPYLSITIIDLTRREYSILLPLLVISITFGVYPLPIIEYISVPISSLLYHLYHIISYLPDMHPILSTTVILCIVVLII